MAQHFRNSERQETEAQEVINDGLDVMPEPVVEQLAEPVVESDPLLADVTEIPLDDPLSSPVVNTTSSTEAVAVPDPFSVPDEPLTQDDSLVYQADDTSLAEPALEVPPASPAAIPAVAPVATQSVAVDRSGDPSISLQNVTVVYPSQPNKPALDGVSVDIYPGEFVFIVGHSGSGKSTFIRLLTREIKATKGKVLIGGQDLSRMRNRKVPILRRQLGCVFQDFKLLPDKTVAQNVAFALECIGKPKSLINAQVPEVLRLVGLSEKMDAYPDQLSGGEQQRVAVARAMVNRPPLLICDEPTGNLDPAISMGIMKLLDAINRNGTTVVMATHDRQMVDAMQKRVIQLDNGQLVRDQEGGYGVYNIEGGEGYYV